MTQISVQVLDGVHGRPAPGVIVDLEQHDEGRWNSFARDTTREDGCLPVLAGRRIGRGRYRLAVRSASYFATLGSTTHYGEFAADFQVSESDADLRATIYVSPATFTAFWAWK